MRASIVIFLVSLAGAAGCRPRPPVPVTAVRPVQVDCYWHAIKYRGETLDRAAARYGVARRDRPIIAEANPALQGRTLSRGEQVCIPRNVMPKRRSIRPQDAATPATVTPQETPAAVVEAAPSAPPPPPAEAEAPAPAPQDNAPSKKSKDDLLREMLEESLKD